MVNLGRKPLEHRRLGRGLRLRHVRTAAVCVVAAGVLAGCSSGSSVLSSASSGVSSIGSSISSRFGQIFGSNSQAVGEASSPAGVTSGDAQLTCPPVGIRAGASTLAVGLPGKSAVGSDLRYQVTITRTARDCNLNGNQITARVGIEGRVIVGPAGGTPSVDIPLRVAVVQEGIQDKIVFTKFYRTSVAMSGDNVAYSFVAEDVVYPVPSGNDNDSYIFYIGFDPNGLKSQPAPRPARRSKSQG
jgi:hypothetical protein